ncbi:MAG: GDSL-type esterase/lipase family protein [Chloroflexota bacterium]
MHRAIVLVAAVLLLAGCAATPAVTLPPPPSPGPSPTDDTGRTFRYVALGDSYTIGYGLPRQADRWPNQLIRALRSSVPLRLVENLAAQSDSTSEVIDNQLPVLEELAPVDLVTLTVGVSDVLTGVTEDEYRENLQVILDGRERSPGQRRVSGILDVVPADRVVLITTPDYTKSPDQPYRRPGDSAMIARFNEIMKEEATVRGIAVVDISPIGDLVARDPTLVLDDGMRASAKQYAGWVELIAPVVQRLLIGGPGDATLPAVVPSAAASVAPSPGASSVLAPAPSAASSPAG